MHKNPIILLIAAAFILFSNSLLNDFIGDDEIIIIDNSFYKSWSNFGNLFTQEYLTKSEKLFVQFQPNYGSGSVAYRPVLSMTYFFDYWIWKLNPFGYHLFNLLLHIGNTLLVYTLVFCILRKSPAALLGALLFSIHPFKSEAVCNIGYRADILSSFFVLSSFILFIKYFNGQKSHKGIYVLSLISYFLALFTKESAIVLPLLLLVYDACINRFKIKTLLKSITTRYLGFWLITAFYLYVYIIVFPNETIGRTILGGTVLKHGIFVLWIFTQYCIGFCLPFYVKMVPPLYAPIIGPEIYWKAGVSLCVLLLLLLLYLRSQKRSNKTDFLLLWFLISWIPVSNIIPIVNPMAHRFMYLPSVGILTLFSLFYVQFSEFLRNNNISTRLDKIAIYAFIGFCLAITFLLNSLWKNNFTVALNLVNTYPVHDKGYAILGIEYFKRGICSEAVGPLKKCAEFQIKDPRIYYMLGICHLNDPGKAEVYFQTSIKMAPHYSSPYLGMGTLYYLQENYEKAGDFFIKSLEIAPSFSAYKYLILISRHFGKEDDAEMYFNEAMQKYKNKDKIEDLKRIYNQSSE